MLEIIATILNFLSPAEQAVYVRLWARTHSIGETSCTARFEDIARAANVSQKTGKLALLKLEGRGLIEIERFPKAPSRFTVHTSSLEPEAPQVLPSRVLQVLEAEDRALFLGLKQALGPAQMLRYKEIARSEERELDEVLLFATFGPARLKPYLRYFPHRL